MGELTMAELDDEICSLAARINVASARLLLLVGEFDEREGWAGYGVKRARIGCPGSASSAATPRVSRSGSPARCAGCR